MTRIYRTASLGVMVIATLLAFALPAAAGHHVPFKGYADDRVTSVEAAPDGSIHLTNAATGHATHLGWFTRVGSGIIYPDGTVEAVLVWTAANGDQLFANVADLLITPTSATGTYVFTGGTGRFENVSGQADFVGVTSDGIHFPVAFSGIISSPGASQK